MMAAGAATADAREEAAVFDEQVNAQREEERDERIHLAVDGLGKQAGGVEEHQQGRTAQGEG